MYRKLYTHKSLKFTDNVKVNTAKCMFRARHHYLTPNLPLRIYSRLRIMIIFAFIEL